MLRRPFLPALFLLVATTIGAHAQSATPTPTPGAKPAPSAAAAPAKAPSDSDKVDESDERPPMFATGMTAGALRRNATRTDQVLAAVFQYQPAPWLTLSAAPAYGRSSAAATGSGATRLAASSSSGLTDIPLSAGVSHEFGALPWIPSLGAALSATVATGDSASGLGLGHSSSDVELLLGAMPVDRVHLSLGASQPLASASGNGSLSLETALSMGRATTTLSFSNEVGTRDSGSVLAQSVAGGVAFSVLGPLTLTLDAGRGLSRGAPGWTMSVGLGTAFAGISPLGVTSPFRRLKKVFGKKLTARSGFRPKPSKSCTIIGRC